MRLFPIILLFFLSCSCSMWRSDPKEDDDFDRYAALDNARLTWTVGLHGLRNLQTTWPVNDCDGFIWSAKAAAAGTAGVNMAMAEYPGEPGRYGRRPPIDGKWCWPDGGSASSWSADMFKCGMLPYAIITGALDMLQWHRAYGQDNGWQMGDPASSDRVYYRPNIRGWLSRAIEYLGGGHDDDALLPDVYLAGLTDYQAHLQMCGIWADGEMAGGLTPAQLDRIEEHYGRSPNTLFYAFMYGRWVSGDIDAVADMLLSDPAIAGDYVRCGDSEPACQMAEKAFVAMLVLRTRP